MNEKSISDISTKYKIHRGLLQNLQQSAATFAGVVTTFCKALGADWNLLTLILTQFRERLFFGIHPDLMDLMKIASMSSTKIARALFKSGLEKLSDLANSKALSVENVLIDLGGTFFVSGKSTEMTADELAKLMISDARNHVRCEMGLKWIEWGKESEEELNDSQFPEEKLQDLTENLENSLDLSKRIENFKSVDTSEKLNYIPNTFEVNIRKRKAESQIKSQFFTPESSKKLKTTGYRQKLRSSGEDQEFKSPEIDVNASLFNAANFSPANKIFPNDFHELTQKFLTIIDVTSSQKLFDRFKEEIKSKKVVGMSVGVKKLTRNSLKIGGNLLGQEVATDRHFTFDEVFYIDCFSFCYDGKKVYLLKVQAEDLMLKNFQAVKNFLVEFFSRPDLTLNIYEARETLKILQKALNVNFLMKTIFFDPRIASWLIDPDTNLTWNEMITKFTPEHLEMLKIAAKHTTRSSLGLSANSSVEPKTRSAIECFLVNLLLANQIKTLKSTEENEKLFRVFQSLEMSIQASLMRMELSGFPVNVKKLQASIEKGTSLKRSLEQHIFELNGRKFNLSSSKEVAKVVGIHRSLESKKRISTAKNVLKKLDLPIAKCIMTWRTLEKTITNMLPYMKLVKDGRIYGNSFSLTQTGRISMYEPNLQNITKDFVVEVKSESKVL